MDNENSGVYGYEPKQNANKRVRNKSGRKRTKLIYLAMLLVVVILAVVLFCGVLLKVSDVTVSGASRYTPEEIFAACSIKEGDNLVTADTDKAAEKITELLPYIGYAEVRKKLPSTIEVYVEEAETMAVIKQGGTYINIDKSGKVLEIQTSEPENYTIIEGIVLILPEAGKTIQFQNENVKEIYTQLHEVFEKNNAEKVDLIDMNDLYNLSFVYDGRIKVILGTPEDISYKVSFAFNVLKNSDGTGLSETDRGTLDLSRAGTTDRAIFTPEEDNNTGEGNTSDESSASEG